MKSITLHDAASAPSERRSAAHDTRVISSLAILGAQVANLDWSSALALIEERLGEDQSFTHIAFLNANNANIMVSDEGYRRVLGRSLVLPDGIGVDIAARILYGDRFLANLNGTDLVPTLLTYVERPLRVGLLGAKPEVLEKATANLQQHAPWHQFICISDGYFDPAQPEVVIDRLAASNLDLLLVAMGTPLQESWIDRSLGSGEVRVAMSVGALFDFVSGDIPRAPSWVRALRLEWLYRLWLEPSRLWRRYILGIPVFLFHVLSEKRREAPVR
ncbi:WecB/TagA/CpsF family glycosyltransferase [Peteryoungia ipomoeae]|uniref:WecB/TagA/CpsF family glycosyltransferase n=1 Tax=Peteryoungia ipomoeae TaxID=1210932 RepID=A0A4S8P7J1_9HYPH|nr:WecB/TagA/CpsF family glycosyltransferase [Peteryoungia ipomoeae]THV23679.1 WecB/TagA/CpsF family glycosyltransferase [Peteryoungia ipomoeae]